MEIRLKPLRRLVKQLYWNEIPSSAWTPELTNYFTDLKACISSSPILTRFDSAKSTFLKIGWSSEGMGWILMQPANDGKSRKVTVHLAKTGIYLFELSKN